MAQSGKKIGTFLKSQGYTEQTAVNYRRMLGYFFEWFDEKSIALADFTADHFIEYLETKDWGATEYQALHSLKSFLRWQYGEDHPFVASVRSKKLRIRREDPGPQRTLSVEEVNKLLDMLESSRARSAKRDLPMVLLMLDTGLRSSEVCSLELENLELDNRRLTVLGKGRKWRTVVFSEETRVALKRWLKIRNKTSRDDTTRLFVGMGGSTPGGPVTRDGLRAIFRSMGKRAGIEGLSPHVLRRTFATLAIQRGASTRLVQVAGGWSSVALVERYSQALSAEDFDGYFASEWRVDFEKKEKVR